MAVGATVDGAYEPALIETLTEFARRFRLDLLQMIFEAQSGHPGSSLSCIDNFDLSLYPSYAPRLAKPTYG